MKELQGLLFETNSMLEHAGSKITVPLGSEWVFYEVSETTFGLPQSVGRIQDLQSDYVEHRGIGMVVPSIPELPEVLADTQAAAAKIIAIQRKHISTIDDMSHLCNHHVLNPHHHASRVTNGGILRIQIDAQSAVFQVLFPIPHGLYSVAYEWDLRGVIDGDVFRKHPFSQIPPDFMISDGQPGGRFVPATQENIIRADKSTPLNARSKKAPYKSSSAEVFQRFQDMAEELLAR